MVAFEIVVVVVSVASAVVAAVLFARALKPEKVDAIVATFGPRGRPDPHIPASTLPPLVGKRRGAARCRVASRL